MKAAWKPDQRHSWWPIVKRNEFGSRKLPRGWEKILPVFGISKFERIPTRHRCLGLDANAAFWLHHVMSCAG
jgi:hypothetical protein